MDQLIEDKLRYHKLYDIYKDLLTDKQRTYFEYYYLDDYSLSEIADILEVSRNAIFEQLKTVIKHLEHYEEVLHNLQNKETKSSIIQEFYKITKDESILDLVKLLEKEE